MRYLRSILSLISRLFYVFFKRIRGYTKCPACHNLSLKWESDNPIHFDGPPLLMWWQCYNSNCRYSSDLYTPLLDRAAQKYGYSGFTEFMKDKICNPKDNPNIPCSGINPIVDKSPCSDNCNCKDNIQSAPPPSSLPIEDENGQIGESSNNG